MVIRVKKPKKTIEQAIDSALKSLYGNDEYVMSASECAGHMGIPTSQLNKWLEEYGVQPSLVDRYATDKKGERHWVTRMYRLSLKMIIDAYERRENV